MSQADAGTAVATGPAPTGASAAGQTAGNVQQGQQQGADDGFVRVPKESLADWGGDWHALAGAAKAKRDFERRYNATLDQIAAYNDANAAQGQPEPEPEIKPDATGQDQGEPPLTAAQLKKLLDDRDAETAKKTKKQQEEAQKQQRREQARNARTRAAQEALKAAGFGPDDKGKSPDEAEALGLIFDYLVSKGMIEDVPEFDRNNPDRIRDALDYSPPKDTHTAKATKALQALLTAIGAKHTAKFAEGQKDTPDNTLGSGTGGGQPRVSIQNMTPQQLRERRLQTARHSLDRNKTG